MSRTANSRGSIISKGRNIQELPAIVGGTPVRPRDRFLVFGAPVLGEAELVSLDDCLRRRWIGTGPKVAEFESAFAEYKGAKHAVALNSCTAALHLSMLASGIGPGDEVILSAMTFCSTANAIEHTGATPVLVDCDRATFNVTADRIAERITDRTKAVLLVHMCGRCCDMAPIVELCREHGLLIIEDCAHAIEASYRGVPAGLLGDVGCFSFYATKNLTTGEGGMVLTGDADLAAEVTTLANHGMSANAWDRYSDAAYRHYTVVRSGYKYNMPDLNAAIGLVQLAKLEERAQRRAEIWQHFTDTFADLPCHLPPPEEPDTRHARHLFTPLLDLDRLSCTRDKVLDALTAEHIGVGVHYLPVHRHPYYRERWKDEVFENAEFIGERTMSLPLAGEMSDEDVEDTCRAFRRVIQHFHRPRIHGTARPDRYDGAIDTPALDGTSAGTMDPPRRSPMQVVILCGGKGTRAYPYTEYMPKPMMPIAGAPILLHVMRIFAAQGHNEIILSLGYLKEVIVDYFHNKHLPWNIQFVDTGLETDTGGRIRNLAHLLNDQFMVTYVDGVSDIRLDKLIDFHNSHPGVATVTAVPLVSQYGTISMDDSGCISLFREKPVLRDYWINAGFFVFDKEVFDSWEGTNLEKEVLTALVRKKLVYAYRHDGFFKSMDTYKDQRDIEDMFEDGVPPWCRVGDEVHFDASGLVHLAH